jgi:TPR repeat protein
LGRFALTARSSRGQHRGSKEWYRKVAELKDATAQYNIGAIYLYGKGVPQDNLEACAWIAVAAANGDASAAAILKKNGATLKGGLFAKNRVAEGKQRAAVYVER